jgi:signal peptidase I
MRRSTLAILLCFASIFAAADAGQAQPFDDAFYKFRQDFEARYLPSGSMLPTIQIDDRLLIDKHTYRKEAPKRGDLVLFNPTASLRKQNFRDPFIKRVIGLPGETLSVRGGKVYINNRPLKESYLSESPAYEHGTVKVPANSYFVLGDNRNNSYDSHYWGFVPRSLIMGKVIGIYCPVDRQRIVDITKPMKSENQEMLDWMQQMFRNSPALCTVQTR